MHGNLNNVSSSDCPTNVPPEVLERIDEFLAEVALTEKAVDEADQANDQAHRDHRSATEGLGEELLQLKEKYFVSSASFKEFVVVRFKLKKSRINEILRIARGDINEDQLRLETLRRVQRHRAAKKKALQPVAGPAVTEPLVTVAEPPPSSGAFDCTENSEDKVEDENAKSAERMKATHAALEVAEEAAASAPVNSAEPDITERSEEAETEELPPLPEEMKSQYRDAIRTLGSFANMPQANFARLVPIDNLKVVIAFLQKVLGEQRSAQFSRLRKTVMTAKPVTITDIILNPDYAAASCSIPELAS